MAAHAEPAEEPRDVAYVKSKIRLVPDFPIKVGSVIRCMKLDWVDRVRR